MVHDNLQAITVSRLLLTARFPYNGKFFVLLELWNLFPTETVFSSNEKGNPMIVDTISLFAPKDGQLVQLNVCAVPRNAIPTFRFVPYDKGCSSSFDEITATYNLGRWTLSCSSWTVNREEVRKYCKEVLQQKLVLSKS